MKRIFALAGFALALSPVQAQQAPAEAEAEAGAADAAELAPLTVTADPFADRSPVESTQPAEVLGHEALERARAQTLGESLDGLPGVRSADFGAGSSRPVIRGQGGPRVRVLDGGASVADASTISPDHNVAVEPFRAQQIEVLKGPATLLYGSGAIGGVVNVVSDLLPQQPLTRMTGSIGVQAGSVDEARSGYGHVEGGNGRVAFTSTCCAVRPRTTTSLAAPKPSTRRRPTLRARARARARARESTRRARSMRTRPAGPCPTALPRPRAWPVV